MDYLVLPPEINSARIESGPGSGPLLAASAAWMDLGDALVVASTQMAASLDSLISAWAGSASATAMTALATYQSWMMQTAEMAFHTAGLATAAASAYETTRAAMVPLVAVLANRAQLAMLVATNILGQNTPAIMATEAIYAEMWAQDVSAMSGYQAESAAATTQLQPPTPAPAITTGALPQGVTQAATAATLPAQTSLGSIWNWLTSPNSFLTALNNPATPIGFVETQWLSLSSSGPWQSLTYPLMFAFMGQANGMMSRANDLTAEGNATSEEMARADEEHLKAHHPGESVPNTEDDAANPGRMFKEPLGSARSVGALSVPPRWTEQMTLASKVSPLETSPSTMGGMMPMPIAAVSAPDRKQRKADEVLRVRLELPKHI